jgi:hypothetical protein
MSTPPKAAAPALPPTQTCAKCGAVFKWELRDPAIKNSPLTANLQKPSDTCDCGYGALAPVFE